MARGENILDRLPVGVPVTLRRGFTFIDEVGSAEDGAFYVRDIVADRRDVSGWPTRDRAAPEEEC